jgi:hypothetical protein
MEATSGVLAGFLLLKRDSFFQAKGENTGDERDKKKCFEKKEISHLLQDCTAISLHKKTDSKGKNKGREFSEWIPCLSHSHLVSSCFLFGSTFSFLSVLFSNAKEQ